MQKLTATVTAHNISIGPLNFDTKTQAEEWVQEQVNSGAWGKSERTISQEASLPKPESSTLLRTEEHEDGLGKTVRTSFYDCPAEYTFEISEDIEAANKMRRQVRIQRGLIKARKCEEAISYMIDYNEDKTEAEVTAMLTNFSQAHTALEQKRIDSARLAIQAITESDMQEIKSDLLEILS